MRRVVSLALALLILIGTAAASEALPTAQPTQEPLVTSETARELVALMFRAAAGTTFEEEKALRASYDKEEAEELAAVHREELRLNREKALVWLKEALRPEEKPDPLTTGTPEPTVTPTPTPTETPDPMFTPDPLATPEPPVWTLDDAWGQFGMTEQGREYAAALEALGASGAAESMEVMRLICAQWMSEVKHDELEEMNDDYSFWLYCADTQIDYPVVHGEDNSYYLKRMFNGEKNSAGTLFVDYRNLGGLQDPNTLVYGHHMRNNSMFGALNDYELDGYFEAHPYLLIMSSEEIALIEIFAGYTTSEDDHCYDIAISDEEDMLDFLNTAMKKSDFDSGLLVSTDSRLITLSTCAYAFRNARYIAIGRLNTVWRADEMNKQ